MDISSGLKFLHFVFKLEQDFFSGLALLFVYFHLLLTRTSKVSLIHNSINQEGIKQLTKRSSLIRILNNTIEGKKSSSIRYLIKISSYFLILHLSYFDILPSISRAADRFNCKCHNFKDTRQR